MAENATTHLTWHCHTFDSLTNAKLYDMLALRQTVFCIEQTCIYHDIDYQDQRCLHLLGYNNTTLAAYLRIFAPEGDPPTAIIGRVVTSPLYRGKGLGKTLLREGIAAIHKQFGLCRIKMSAQAHLQPFYNQFGFTTVSEPYDEDGIPHVEMHMSMTNKHDPN